MDVLFFLQKRTEFIKAFYEEACFTFSERQRKIQAGESPYEPPYSEDSEPPFLDEWMEADESIDVLGQMCISMLSSSLQLFLEESVNDLLGMYSRESLAKADIGLIKDHKSYFKEGWINGFRMYFLEQLSIDWTKSGSNLTLLEEIVLTRNRAQHPEQITTLSIKQSERDAAKYPRSFFADDLELGMLGDDYPRDEWIYCIRLKVTKERLFAAIEEVNLFCSWLDDTLRKWPSN